MPVSSTPGSSYTLFAGVVFPITGSLPLFIQSLRGYIPVEGVWVQLYLSHFRHFLRFSTSQLRLLSISKIESGIMSPQKQDVS